MVNLLVNEGESRLRGNPCLRGETWGTHICEAFRRGPPAAFALGSPHFVAPQKSAQNDEIFAKLRVFRSKNMQIAHKLSAQNSAFAGFSPENSPFVDANWHVTCEFAPQTQRKTQIPFGNDNRKG
jgi:hypothetical protein